MKPKILITALVVLVLMIGLSIRATWQIRDVNVDLAALEPERNQMREALNRAEKRLQTARAARIDLGEDAAASDADATDVKRGGGADTPATHPSTKPAAPRPSAHVLIADDPD